MRASLKHTACVAIPYADVRCRSDRDDAHAIRLTRTLTFMVDDARIKLGSGRGTTAVRNPGNDLLL